MYLLRYTYLICKVVNVSVVVDVVNTYWAIIGLPKKVGSALLRRLKYSDTLSNFSGAGRHLVPLSLLIYDLVLNSNM